MLYASLMLLTLACLWACWRNSPAMMPVFLLTALLTAWLFASDITNKLSISL